MTLFLQSNGTVDRLREAGDTSQVTQYVGAGVQDFTDLVSLTNPDSVYTNQRAVRTVVNFIAHNAASIPLHGFRTDKDDERTRVKTGAVGAILTSPDLIATQYEYLRDMFKDVLLWERFAAFKVRHPSGGVELIRVPPRLFVFNRSGSGRPTTITIGEDTFPLSGFMWLDGYPASDKSPMAHLTDLLLEEAASAKFRANLWGKGAQAGGVIERPPDAPDWSPKARKRFRELLASRYTGNAATDAGGTMLLEDGMTYKSLDHMSSRDGQQIEARKLSTSEVAAAYQVPPVFVGVLDNANYSNVQAYRGMLYSDVLGPLLVQSQQAWTLRVAVEFPDITYLEHAVDAKLALSFEEQAAVLQAAVGGPYMTRAEARKRQNLAFIAGTDTLLEPLNISTGSNDEDPKPPEPEPETEPETNESEETDNDD